MDLLSSIVIGISLAAACGFRIFVPLLVMSIAAQVGHLTLAPELDWIGTQPALATFAVATALEIGGYYIPWVDNLLDSIATPTAVVAGTIMMGAVVTDMDPLFKWALALVAGGGTAGAVQGVTVLARGTSRHDHRRPGQPGRRDRRSRRVRHHGGLCPASSLAGSPPGGALLYRLRRAHFPSPEIRAAARIS